MHQSTLNTSTVVLNVSITVLVLPCLLLTRCVIDRGQATGHQGLIQAKGKPPGISNHANIYSC